MTLDCHSFLTNRALAIALMFAAFGISACGSNEDSSATIHRATPADHVSAQEETAEPGSATQKPDGVITATLNGTERTWYTTSAERGGQYISQSDWSSLFGDQINVSIMGHVSPLFVPER